MNSDKPIVANESWPVEPCLDGYEYDRTEVISSIVIDVSFIYNTLRTKCIVTSHNSRALYIYKACMKIIICIQITKLSGSYK